MPRLRKWVWVPFFLVVFIGASAGHCHSWQFVLNRNPFNVPYHRYISNVRCLLVGGNSTRLYTTIPKGLVIGVGLFIFPHIVAKTRCDLGFHISSGCVIVSDFNISNKIDWNFWFLRDQETDILPCSCSPSAPIVAFGYQRSWSCKGDKSDFNL